MLACKTNNGGCTADHAALWRVSRYGGEGRSCSIAVSHYGVPLRPQGLVLGLRINHGTAMLIGQQWRAQAVLCPDTPPRQSITAIICPEYFMQFWGGDYAKIA